MRQLLVWSSSRAQNASSPTSFAVLPVIEPDMKLRLKNIQDDVIRMLAEGQVDTNPSSENKAEGKASGHKVLMPNPTNVKNQERLSRWGANIERCVIRFVVLGPPL
jgi:Mis12-Mtw1 protein family